MRGWRGVRQNHARPGAVHRRVSGRIAGSRTVVASIRRPRRREVCARRMLPGNTRGGDRLGTTVVPSLSEPTLNAQHEFGVGPNDACEIVRVSKWHDWEFATRNVVYVERGVLTRSERTPIVVTGC